MHNLLTDLEIANGDMVRDRPARLVSFWGPDVAPVALRAVRGALIDPPQPVELDNLELQSTESLYRFGRVELIYVERLTARYEPVCGTDQRLGVIELAVVTHQVRRCEPTPYF